MFGEFSRRSAVRVNYVTASLAIGKRHFAAVGRNARERCQLRSIGELPPFAAVGTAAPQCLVGIRHVSHPLAVARESGISGGNAAEKRYELMHARLEAHQFSPPLRTDREDLFAVATGNKIGVRERTVRKSNRRRRAAKQRLLIGKGPQIHSSAALAKKDQIFLVRRPARTAYFGR